MKLDVLVVVSDSVLNIFRYKEHREVARGREVRASEVVVVLAGKRELDNFAIYIHEILRSALELKLDLRAANEVPVVPL
ncbi:hypothetical protein, partial [Ralstonia solanacearum]|uniref:hypothetical protein n=1 Tax=Ralstonia solanacearum TaxID=305 RepID=UPI00057CB2F5